MNFFAKMFGGSYDDLWKAVIRPPRDEYTEKDLGPEFFNISDKNFQRKEFTIANQRKHKLSCSLWEPIDDERTCKRLPCVIYLHGNSSSKAEAVTELKYLLPMGVCVLSFDFSGCGKSEGEYISLGYYEKDDVKSVVDFLRKSDKISTIGIWGRSMGAVTAIMYGVSDPSVAGLVLDSAFSSLKLLVEELVKDRVQLPGWVLNQALKIVKNTVKKKAKFNLDDIEPIKYAEQCFIPAMFVAAKEDDFVKPHHSTKLHDVYQGDKNLISIDGDHNSARPRFLKDSAAIFFFNTLQVESMKQISENFGEINNVNQSENPSNLANKIEELSLENKNTDLWQFDNQEKNNFMSNENKFQFEDEDDEEKEFQKILEMSKQEYEETQKKQNK